VFFFLYHFRGYRREIKLPKVRLKPWKTRQSCKATTKKKTLFTIHVQNNFVVDCFFFLFLFCCKTTSFFSKCAIYFNRIFVFKSVSTRFSIKWNNLGERVLPRSFFKGSPNFPFFFNLILGSLIFLIVDQFQPFLFISFNFATNCIKNCP
jgi:hypothetical protein